MCPLLPWVHYSRMRNSGSKWLSHSPKPQMAELEPSRELVCHSLSLSQPPSQLVSPSQSHQC